MAKKFNWEKLNKDSKVQSQNELSWREKSDIGDIKYLKKTGIWTLKGKYFGHHISKLPLSYLEFIIDKFKVEPYTTQAIVELNRRFKEFNT